MVPVSLGQGDPRCAQALMGRVVWRRWATPAWFPLPGGLIIAGSVERIYNRPRAGPALSRFRAPYVLLSRSAAGVAAGDDAHPGSPW